MTPKPCPPPARPAPVLPETYRASQHIYRVVARKGFDLADVLAVANRPGISYASRNGGMRHVGRGLCVLVDPDTMTIITVYAHRVETTMREDQADKVHVVEHFARRGERTA